MKTYLLLETLTPCRPEELDAGAGPYVALLTPAEWKGERGRFFPTAEPEPEFSLIRSTKADVGYDSMTGTFRIPDRQDVEGPDRTFAFALDGRGLVFIDGGGTAEEMVSSIGATRHWQEPCLERFLYDFLETIVAGDLEVLDGYGHTLDLIEDEILARGTTGEIFRVNRIRSSLRILLSHYEQLIDLAQELEENENGFFDEKRLRYLRLFINRASRLRDMAASLRDHAGQVRDLHREQLAVRENRVITVLTVVSTIFMPLTLVTGWYGMNFRYMPELDSPWGYPAVMLLCLLIAVTCLLFFKKKKWL